MAFLGYRTPSSSATSVAEKLGGGIGEGVNALLSSHVNKLQQKSAYNEFIKDGYAPNVANLLSRYHNQPDILKQLFAMQGIPNFESETSISNAPSQQRQAQQQELSPQEQAVNQLFQEQPSQQLMQPQGSIQAAPFSRNPFYEINNPLAELRQLFERQNPAQQMQQSPTQQLLQGQKVAQPQQQVQQQMQQPQEQPTIMPKQAESIAKNVAKQAVTYKKAGGAGESKERVKWLDSLTDTSEKASNVIGEMDDFEKLVNNPAFKTGWEYQIGKTATGLSDANSRADKIIKRIKPAMAAVQQGSAGRITNQMLNDAEGALPNPYQMDKQSLIEAARSIKDMFGLKPLEYAEAAINTLKRNKGSSLEDIKLAVNEELQSRNRQPYSLAQNLQSQSQKFQVGQSLSSLPDDAIEGMEADDAQGRKLKFFDNNWHVNVNGVWKKLGK